MSKWRARTRADVLSDIAAEHLARIFGDDPPRNQEGRFVSSNVVDVEARAPIEGCSGCNRTRPVFELVIAENVPGVAPGAYCGACRGRMERSGVITRAEWAAALGAPPEVVEKLGARSLRTQPTMPSARGPELTLPAASQADSTSAESTTSGSVRIGQVPG